MQTTTLGEPVPATVTTPPGARRRLVGAALAVLLAVAGWGGWVWSHPRLLPDLAGTVALSAPTASGGSLATTMVYPTGDRETLVLESLRPVLDEPEAPGVGVAFAICHRLPDEDPPGAARDAAEHCRDLEPVHLPMRFVRGPDDLLVLTLTASRPGQVHVTGVDVGYRRSAAHLWQRGVQRVRVDAVLTVPG
ncbi:hypothetical protein K8Z61_08075 [Nocardioides sp. TRM66260-LWL]|uniref:hypothetical protein n=1 Tax=Nocardioides sp. TRM66260-LWL TaxID=2874478 RepID=UPI001CC4F60A|nr:hypothetical protein [Nocardioides sp. TRM66260-LWL]MBZ5734452.1 hypothetical protein [Nocardioides sp. TRM66260-LWL]